MQRNNTSLKNHKINVTPLLWRVIEYTDKHKATQKNHTEIQVHELSVPSAIKLNKTSCPPIDIIFILWWLRHVPVPCMYTILLLGVKK